MSHPQRCFLLLAMITVGPVSAGDWPQWRGPDRTGISAEKGLLKEWPKEGPKLDWKITGLGDGFSTPAIAKGVIYTIGTKGKDEHIFALAEKDGKQLWDVRIGVTDGGKPGPRCTPTVESDRLYAMSSDGKLVCAKIDKGEIVWRKDLKADFGGKTGNWAYAESVLIDGDVLVCTPGGDAATLVALKKQSGDVIWRAPVTGLAGGKRAYNTAGYSSAIVVELGGVKQYVQFVGGGVVGVAAKDGKLLWHYDKPANGTANCSTPIVSDGSVFAASAYGNGGGRAKIAGGSDGFKAEELYFVKQMQNHHGGMVLVGEHIYGTGSGSLLCVNFKNGEVVWQERGVGKGSVFYADGHIYHRGEGGGMALVETTPTGYKEKGRFTQPDRSKQPAWPHPVVANGKLYLRDWDALFCYDVKAK